MKMKITTFKKKFHSFIILIKKILFTIFLYLLYFVKYLSFLGAIVFLLSLITCKIYCINLSKNNTPSQYCSFHNIKNFKEKTEKITKTISLLKGYNIKYSILNGFNIYPFYRIPQFKFQNQFYDRDLNLIEENINENNYFIWQVIGTNKDFLYLYLLFAKVDKAILEYNGIRWDIIVFINNKNFLIKLPIDITDITKKKVRYLFENYQKCFDSKFNIIDLRFGNKIYLVE